MKTPEFSKAQINEAGRIIKKTDGNNDKLLFALEVIDNWRESHVFPLQIIYCHLKRRYKNKGYIIAQRLKRLRSIIGKMQRETTMSLWTMQDLGGCRTIVPTIEEVYMVVKELKSSRIRHILKKENDYINNPKNGGYRSYHIVYQYHSDRKDTYNSNFLIEIQIRTRLQHLWATAVETMGLFTNQALKASVGEQDILRFFALISSLFAMKENTTTVPNTHIEKNRIIKELREIDKKRRYLAMLSGIRVASVNYWENDTNIKQVRYVLLIFNYETRMLGRKYFRSNEIDLANKKYSEIENKDDKNIDAVLVSVSSLSTLKAAFPNYFADIKDFIKIVNEYIVENSN